MHKLSQMIAKFQVIRDVCYIWARITIAFSTSTFWLSVITRGNASRCPVPIAGGARDAGGDEFC